MSDHRKTPHPLVPVSSNLPAARGEQAGASILQRMTQSALQVSRARRERVRYRVGSYEFCEPDYRQLLLWADRLGLKPEEVLNRLADAGREENLPWYCRDFLSPGEHTFLVVRDGRFRQILWDGKALPLEVFEWVPGLQLETLVVTGAMSAWPTEQKLPSLRRLVIRLLGLRSPDLRPVPGLTWLYCGENQLTALDLSPVPGLKVLHCERNELTALDLGPVPGLISLQCWGNRLTTLDLRPVRNLKLRSVDDQDRIILRDPRKRDD
jgi:hypothetical protein